MYIKSFQVIKSTHNLMNFIERKNIEDRRKQAEKERKKERIQAKM